MEVEARVKTKNTAMFDDVGHCSQSTLILVACGYSMAALSTSTALGKQNRDLGTELREFEWAGEKGDDGAGCGAGRAKAGNGV